MSNQASDILEEMTKGELVEWIRQHTFSKPKRSQVLYIRWQRQSLKLESDTAQELEILKGFDFDHRSRLWQQYNQEPKRQEKLKLLEQIRGFNDRYTEHQKRWAILEQRQKKVDTLYRLIDVARHAEGYRGVVVA
ncbi:hypothetical protein [Pseudomonas sp. B26(2017)]|uniref:hypothetical protein n=1 Tax=Pseudomonas sp. B26(2017) TaxID=1981732 RepID=UPI000A1F226C|nr:hypothetical protein [Pseudomonas sp. B26(2017)]